MKYRWKITKILDEYGRPDLHHYVGVEGPANASDDTEMPWEFRMTDDDGLLWVYGTCSHEEFFPLEDFGMPGFGCTQIEYKQSNGKWEML